jgi:geranyl-CoA carboxylase alpha subunit
MEEAGVACVPGWHGEAQDMATLREAALEVGFPLMIKAAAGGGGHGMRVVAEASELEAALESARSEAEAGFGDRALILERLIADARHVEVQVFGDRHGTVVHLGARDCSVQRRHQKVIEEAPPPGLAPEVAEGVCAAAVRVAQAIGYVGAGTVEFLVGAGGAFHFLEMNTRLQVEHPVTEMVTAEDLVEWQLRIAAGEPLPKRHDEIVFSGHAIEARLYAEDPPAGFLPQAGRVLAWRPGAGEGVRVDDGIADGVEVPSHYDPLVAKVIAHGEDREQARARLIAALRATVLLGVRSNKRYLLGLLGDEAFARGAVTTRFAEARALDDRPTPEETALAAALVFEASLPARPDPWRNAGTARWPMTLCEGERRHSVAVVMAGEGRTRVETGDDAIDVVPAPARPLGHLCDGTTLWLDAGDGARAWEDVTYAPATPPQAAVSGRVSAPIAGRVVRVAAAPGEAVAAGATLVVIESMKIEHAITAPAGGVVETVAVSEGDQVAARAPLVEIAPAGDEAQGESDGGG